MNKIVVTEEQAKAIESELKCKAKKHEIAWFLAMNTDLDLVTIARIVEGEPYEVEYEFKVGDVVQYLENNEVFFVYSIEKEFVNCKATDKEGDGARILSYSPKNLRLISKAENREDLKTSKE